MKQQQHLQPAVKANKMRPFISGFHGQHAMEVGVAYWYRGHYLYGPARNPIEPLQFATKKEGMVMGTAAGTAPIYKVSHSKYNIATVDSVRERVFEHEVGALRKSMEHKWREAVLVETEKKRVGNGEGLDIEKQFEIAFNRPSSGEQIGKVITPTMKLRQSRLLAPSPMPDIPSRHRPRHIKAPNPDPSYVVIPGAEIPSLAQTAMASITDSTYARLLDLQFTPNDRVRFLAHSVPRSQVQKPNRSRHISPALTSFSVGSGALKPVASTSSLRRLLAEEGIKRQKAPIPLETLVEEGLNRAWMDQSTISAHGRLLSNPSSREPSRPSSREPQVAQKSRFLHPEIHKHDNKEKVPPVYLGKILSGSRTDRHSSEYAFDTSSLIPDIQIDNPEHTIADQYDKSFGEEPHGKVTKCMVHGDECDGVSVGHLHLTETARQGCGFQEKYPTIRNGGREILDWFRIMNEERVKMGMVPIVRHA